MTDDKTTWRALLKEAFAETGDDFSKMVSTMTEEHLDARFDCGFGCAEGCAFTAWGDKYVYFPVVYDGAEWVGRAPRNPCDEATEHQGGS